MSTILPVSTPMAVAIFITIWFVVLFAVLPWGVRSQHEEADYAQGTDPGAPVAPRLLARALWTTAASGVVFAALMAYIRFA